MREDRLQAFVAMTAELHTTAKEDNIAYLDYVMRRDVWLSNYFKAVTKSCCIPGCGKAIPASITTVAQNQGTDYSPNNPSSPKTQRVVEVHLKLTPHTTRRSKHLHLLDMPRKLIDPQQLHSLQKEQNGWYGYVIRGPKTRLSTAYVKKEFTPMFLSSLMERPNRKTCIPVGSVSLMQTHELTQQVVCNASSPPLVLQQMHRDTCVMSSLASAFKYFGDLKSFDIVRRNVQASSIAIDRMQFAVDTICTPELNYRYQRYKQGQLLPLSDLSPFPTLACLCNTDGGVAHCITIVGNIIFDSNTTAPMPLTADSLDWCCSSKTDRGTAKFAFVYEGLRFLHRKPRVDWKVDVSNL